ncbi:hypothetical protein G6674_00700 [Polynucleobacter paneuropaeus]|nr:hypothetical protein G6674_00700 [Polynucleobacter paneuropaeus]
MKKFIALIIDSDAEPIYAVGREIWRRNAKKHNIEIYFLRADEKIADDSIRVEGDTIHSKWIDNFSDRLIDKTLKGFKYCLEKTDCQYILRTNLSSFFDIPLFKTYLESIPPTGIYAGPFEYFPLTLPNGISGNLCFCSGSGYLTSRDIALLALERRNEIPPYFLDDVWLAITLMDIQRLPWKRCDITNIENTSKNSILDIKSQIRAAADEKIFHFRINNSKMKIPREYLDQAAWDQIKTYLGK